MAKPRKRVLFEMRDHWIAPLPGKKSLYHFWTERGTGVTYRASLETADFAAALSRFKKEAAERPQRWHTRPRNGRIYFLQGADGGLIKIGWTRKDPAARVADLQIGSASRIAIIAVVGGTQSDEHGVHRTFKAERAHGEWFEPSPRLLRFIEIIRSTDDLLAAFKSTYTDSEAA